MTRQMRTLDALIISPQETHAGGNGESTAALGNLASAEPVLIFDAGRRGRVGTPVPEPPGNGTAASRLPQALLRTTPTGLPEVSEPQAVRHYTRLSQRNFSIDTNFYPLGSCTMKYNPRACEAAAALPGFTGMHPLQAAADAQGTLAVLHELQGLLGEIVGLPHVSLTPVAGAQGEFAGISIIKSWHHERANGRDIVLVPDSAHGTNPASAALAGLKVKTVKSGPDGRVDLASLRDSLDEHTAALMLTNPNTCGIFEKDILEIARLVHEAGALLYYDGANLNAIVGRARPGDMGFDVVHLNLHKTFSTPHGGGGPGAGPIGVRKDLGRYLPVPRVVRDEDGAFALDDEACGSGADSAADDHKAGLTGDARAKSAGGPIGRLHAFAGNVGVLIRAYTYIRLQGSPGLRDIATHSVLNANYLLARLKDAWDAPLGDRCMHEFILSLRREAKELNVKAFDVSKRLLDFGIHPPTNYFPLLVPECLLIEPTENETKQTLDRFVEVMLQIRREAEAGGDLLRKAPTQTPVRRVDEVGAARQLNVCCGPRMPAPPASAPPGGGD